MKKTYVFYPFLLAIYPVIALFARLPGGLQFASLIRPLIVQILLATFAIALFYFRTKSMLRASLLAALTVFYFSSTGYLYRSIQGSLFASAPPITHLGVVVLGVFIVIVVSQPIVWEKYLTPPRLRSLTRYLNLVSIFVLIYPLYQIGTTIYSASDDAIPAWNKLVKIEEPLQPLNTKALPDIYYIILDGYASAGVLQDVYQFDNSEFIQALQQRGFYVATQSRSNYIWTMLSLSSSLNMDYIGFATEKAGPESGNILPLYELIHQNQVRSLLKEAGYSIVTVSTDYPFTDWTDADVYLYPYKYNPSELERFYLSLTALGALYDPEFSFTDDLRSILPLPSYGTRRERNQYALDQLSTIPEIDGPKFVFIHIIAPHPPFVVDENGNALDHTLPYLPADGLASFGTSDAYQSLYVKQLQFVNKQIQKALDNILSKSSQPPIIIIQGDHGGGSLLQSSLEQSCLFERTSILNAYYFPGVGPQTLYPSITPVNSFRVVFNTYFDAQYTLLPDKTYFSHIARPYDFIDISNQIETTCQTQ